MKTFSSLLTALLLCLFVASCSRQEAADLPFDESFRKELLDNNVAGAGYAVFNADSIVWNCSFGTCDSLKTKQVDLHTRFNIGSVTKVFTALAIMQLHEKGLLDIDKPVKDYIPEFAIEQRFPESAPITIRSVLTHHAGLPGDLMKGKFAEKPGDYRLMLDYLNRQSTCFPVGKTGSYSNLGYSLLGIVIERVSGLSYTEYITKHIFEPARMTESGFYQQYGQEPTLSAGFSTEGNVQKELPLLDIPAGGIYSTVADMVKFGQALFVTNSLIITNKTLEMMLEVQNMDVPLDLRNRIGLCWNISDKARELGRVYEHGGATAYHRAQFWFAPDAGLGGVVLSNSANGVQNAWRIKEEWMVNYVKNNKIVVKNNSLPEKKVSFTSIENKDLKAFTGWYATYGMVCRFDLKHNNLYTTIQGNSFYLAPDREHDFVPARRILGFMAKRPTRWFHFEEIGGEKLFLESTAWGTLNVIGQKFNPQPLTSDWTIRTGKYRAEPGIDNLVNDVEIIQVEGVLVLRFRLSETWSGQLIEAALNPLDKNRAAIIGLGRNAGEVLRFSSANDSFEMGGISLIKE